MQKLNQQMLLFFLIVTFFMSPIVLKDSFATTVWYDSTFNAIAINPYSDGSMIDQIRISLDPNPSVFGHIGQGYRPASGSHLTFVQTMNDMGEMVSENITLPNDGIVTYFYSALPFPNDAISEQGYEGMVFFADDWNGPEGITTLYLRPLLNGESVPVVNNPLAPLDGYYDATKIYVNIYNVTNGWQALANVQDGSWFRLDEFIEGAWDAFAGIIAVPVALINVWGASTPPDFITEWLVNTPNIYGTPVDLNGASLYTASPAFIWADFDVEQDKSQLCFDFRISELSEEDIIFVSINDSVVYSVLGDSLTEVGVNPNEWYSSGLINLSDHLGTRVKLTMGIISEEENHRVDFNNLKFYSQSAYATVDSEDTNENTGDNAGSSGSSGCFISNLF